MKYQDKHAQKTYILAQQYKALAIEYSKETRKSLLDTAQIYEKTARIHEEAHQLELSNRKKRSELIIKIFGINSN